MAVEYRTDPIFNQHLMNQKIRYMIKIGVSFQKKQDRGIALARRYKLETEVHGHVSSPELQKNHNRGYVHLKAVLKVLM